MRRTSMPEKSRGRGRDWGLQDYEEARAHLCPVHCTLTFQCKFFPRLLVNNLEDLAGHTSPDLPNDFIVFVD